MRSKFNYTLERGGLSRDVEVEVDWSIEHNSFTGDEIEVEIAEVCWRSSGRPIGELLFSAVKGELLDHAYDVELL